MTDKTFAALQLEIQNLEDSRRKLEEQARRSGNQYYLALAGVLAGLLLLIFTSWWWLGLLFFLAGALAVFTQGSKKRKAPRPPGRRLSCRSI